MAAAATISGLMSIVRPVGLPWRPLEVTIRGTRAKLIADQLVRVHRQAHGATRGAPFEASFDEDLVEAQALQQSSRRPVNLER